jgi:hypothetical protein
VQITVIQALEIAPPAGKAAILWTLLTSLDVTTLEQARDVLELYGGRSEIEVFTRCSRVAAESRKFNCARASA